MNYYEEIKEKYPDLDSSEEDIKNWQRQAFQALGAKDMERAESLFERLAVARPWQHTGFEGLAYTCFYTGRYKKAEWFMMKAVSIAEGLESKKMLSGQVVSLLQQNLQAIRQENSLIRWWETMEWE
jgi:hypothetical protein